MRIHTHNSRNPVQISLSIDKALIEKAHYLGLNISRTCELALQNKIKLLEQPQTHEQTLFSSGFSAEKSDLVRSPGFEPGSSTWQADVLNHSSEISTESSVNLVARLRPHTEAMIANILIKLQNNARAESNAKATDCILRHLSHNADLMKPEEAKAYIANAKTKEGKPTASGDISPDPFFSLTALTESWFRRSLEDTARSGTLLQGEL